MAGNTVVLGIYQTRAQLEQGVEALRHAGFSTTSISALFPEGDQSREFAFEKGTKAPEGATTGAASGAVIGGALGWLAGVGTLAIPGLGPFIAAGPIMGALAGVGAGSAVGGVTGALIGMGIPEYEAQRYEGRVQEGGLLLSVHCDTSDEEDQAEEILEHTGAQEVSSKSESSADDEAEPVRRQRMPAEPVSRGGGMKTTGTIAAGKSSAGSAWSEYQDDCRRDYERRHAPSGASWSSMEPAYRFGCRMADDPSYQGKSWLEVEEDMRQTYSREKPTSTWESVKDAVRYGWERVSGLRRAA
jgi:hypothetical protein